MDVANQNRALESVSDHVDDSTGGNVDGQSVQKAMQDLATAERKAAEEKAKRQAELAAVKVDKGDIEVIVKEFELQESQAKTVLQENGGDLQAALVSLIKCK
mmetsp:Transcript_3369/g.4877  ORF Transcript_3369/g.4877 Transcript_3369/m.4877 type:complete len:102 (+) Transcript_3369:46-351(+)